MILITGGLGMIGMSMARHFLDMGQEVLATGFRYLQPPSFLASYVGKGLNIIPMDIVSLPTIMDAVRKFNVTSIVHAASRYEGRGTLYESVMTNVIGSANILEAARALNLGRVTFLSSEGVHQGKKDTDPFKEDELLCVKSDRYIPATKKMDEHLFFIYQNEYKMDVVIARPSRIFGPPYPAGRPISRLIAAALKGGEADLTAVVNGNEAHDYLYVRDCARAICTLHLAPRLKHTIYNVGFGKLVTFNDCARTIEKILPGSSLRLGTGSFSSATDTRPITGLDIHACLDITRIKEEFGFSPEYDLERGLSALTAWVRDGVYQ